MGKRVSIINFKGGVGKTTLAFHLAAGLVRFNEDVRVLLIDVDHQSSLSLVCLRPADWDAAVNEQRTIDRVFRHLLDGAPMPSTELVIHQPLARSGYDHLDLVPASLHLDETEIELAAFSSGDPIRSEWNKRTLISRWLESSHLDEQYDYIIFDCPPATKLVTQNALAASHGYIVPAVPEAVMERGAPHLVQLIKTSIDDKLKALAKFGDRVSTYVEGTSLVAVVITRIQTSRGYSGYTNDHTIHLRSLQRQWPNHLLEPYIEQGIGISETLTMGVPVYDRADTQNIGGRGLHRQYQGLVQGLKVRIDAL